MTKEERLKIVLSPMMNVSSIMDYFSIKRTKASQIKKEALKKSRVYVGYGKVKTDAVFHLMGTSRKEELEALGGK